MKRYLNKALTTTEQTVPEYTRLKKVSTIPSNLSTKLFQLKNYINKTKSEISSLERTLNSIKSNAKNAYALQNYYKTGISTGDKLVANYNNSFKAAKSYFLAYGNALQN